MKFKLNSKIKDLAVFAIVFMGISLAPFSSLSTFAASDFDADRASGKLNNFNGSPSPAQYEAAEKLRYFFLCLRLGHARESFSSADANSLNVLSDSNSVIEVGEDLEPDDGKMNCKDVAVMAKPVLTSKISIADFIAIFFEPNSDGGFREITTDPAGNDTVSRAGFMLDDAAFFTGFNGEIRKIKNAAAFSNCFQEVGAGKASDIGPIEGQEFIYRDGKNGNSKIVVGQENVADGELNCTTLAEKAESDGFYKIMKDLSISTGRAFNSPSLLYQAVAAQGEIDTAQAFARTTINNLLSADEESRNKVLFCISSAGLPTNISLNTITEWLATGDSSYLAYTGAGSTSIPATTEQANRLKGCLIAPDAFGTELSDVLETLEQDLEDARAALDGAQNSTGTDQAATESDVCLSEGDNFISWAACPAIELMNGAFDIIKDTIQDMLKFSLEDDQPGTSAVNNEIKNAWSVFRSIATTLVIIFFLTALLVKAIRGE
jgi:hypothetical protein